LFSRNEPPQSSWQVFAWWESRRIPYNIIVGAVGMVSGSLCLVTALLTEHFLGEALGLPNPPIVAVFAVMIYGVMANICYTGGWITEIFVRKVWPHEGEAFGKISFFLGLAFSVFLTLAPGVLIACLGAVSLFIHAPIR
jgi:hypothetical protein